MLPPEPKKMTNKASSDTTPDHGALPGQGEHDASYPAGPPPALASAPGLGTIMQAFRRSWKTILPLAILGAVLGAGLAWYFVPAQYTSIITFNITRAPFGSEHGDESFADMQKAETAFMKSHDILDEAIQKSRVAELYGENWSAQKLDKKLLVTFNGGKRLMAVALSSENPEAAAALLSALGETYVRKVRELDQMWMKNRIAQLERRLDGEKGGQSLTEQLRDKRTELIEAMNASGVDDAKNAAVKLVKAEDALSATRKERTNKTLELTGLRAQKTNLEKRIKNPPTPRVSSAEAEEALKGDPDYLAVVAEVSAYTKMIDRYTVGNLKNPEIAKQLKQLKEKRDLWERKTEVLLNEAKRKLSKKFQTLGVERDKEKLDDVLSKIEQGDEQLKAMDKELLRLQGEVDAFRTGGVKEPPEVTQKRDQLRVLEREHDRLTAELADLKTKQKTAEPRISLARDAFVPTEKEYNRPIKFGLGAGVGMFALVLVGLCLLESRNRRVYTSDDIAQTLGLRILGTVPALPAAARSKSAAAQSLGGLDSQYGLTEAIDGIRTMLLHSSRTRGARIIMVASAVSGEAKTTLASHLAASLARAWRKVLLIDGDLRNPQAHLEFDQPLEPGFCEMLRGEVELDEAIRPTLVSRLWMLPGGKVDGHALQALAQEGLDGIFERLKEEYEFIIVDTSPLLLVPDSLLLGQHADAVILSVMRDTSRLPAVYAAQQKLESLGIQILGAVVSGEKTSTYGYPGPYPKKPQV